ncbi:LD-carboxypeptidase [uncultured Alistipes sp.]|jgi:peptidase U61, LD-carboxypeptidase A|uniref:S66 peptidase family protein n=1 Tax=uncultured Alistipes sp. TaxID=538949 RepID=UPI0025DC8115|nr:LD-carboxypeptidase [uncultured Alistipes sp.]
MKRFIILIITFLSTASLFAQQADTLFVRPPYLRWGDTVGIVAPARKLDRKADTAKVRERFASWGLCVKFGTCLMNRDQPYFAGTDTERAADLQAMIDDPQVKAIISFQGGYGSVRLLPSIDLTPLRRNPKWIVGFSDVTTLHLALTKLGVESLHATMPGKFLFGNDEKPEAIVSDESLRSALFGRWSRLDLQPHPLNQPGEAQGRLVGGNLSVLCTAIATPEEPDPDMPTVLFIEDVNEYLYHLDRVMQQLTRSGRLQKYKAILVGHFSKMMGQKHFGVYDPYEIIAAYTRHLDIPVVFGVPAGHEDPNVALFMGREVTVRADGCGASVEF